MTQEMWLTPLGLRFRGRCLPVSIGRGGVTDHKREGDGATPRGRHRIVGVLYRPDRCAAPTPWARPIRPGDLWCDDPANPAYNQLVSAPFSARHERMHRADPLYDLVILTDWNWPEAVPGRGSAIFLHQWRRPHFPTEGCLAFAREDLFWLARHAPPGTLLRL